MEKVCKLHIPTPIGTERGEIGRGLPIRSHPTVTFACHYVSIETKAIF